jgi:hypothetical protein
MTVDLRCGHAYTSGTFTKTGHILHPQLSHERSGFERRLALLLEQAQASDEQLQEAEERARTEAHRADQLQKVSICMWCTRMGDWCI